ncbi:hypothetical protein GCM10009546_74360 [Actinomadura livida]|uniref:Uncharacterized protein n=1 Tax=Actinomadura livida TaxID=79909 RepID=A0ABP3R7V2_9ACTN|nr:hypothetical protein GCM10010208_11990 [Actinomadura livida]
MSGPPSPSGVFGEYIENGGGAMAENSSRAPGPAVDLTRIYARAARPGAPLARFPPGSPGALH